MSTKSVNGIRPTKDANFLEIAKVISKRATCGRRAVGCVITDIDGYILSTGYNGTPKGLPHCSDIGCNTGSKPGENLDSCMALHAEQNAIARLRSPNEAYTLYCTTEPCISCLKLILATNIKRVVYKESYVTNNSLIGLSKLDWIKL